MKMFLCIIIHIYLAPIVLCLNFNFKTRNILSINRFANAFYLDPDNSLSNLPDVEIANTNNNSSADSEKRNRRWYISNSEELLVPQPFNSIVDVNIDRRSVVYEVELGRELGFEILQGVECAMVGDVVPTSRAAQCGIKSGDILAATSATAGDQIWTHDSLESVKSALSTRFVMSATIKLRLERKLDDIPEDLIPKLKVPFFTTVKLRRPIGLHVAEGPGQTVFVQHVKPNLGAARSKRVQVGDQIVSMSASWGDRLWDVNSVESFVTGVRMRTDDHITLRFKRLVPLNVYTKIDTQTGRSQRVLIEHEKLTRHHEGNTTTSFNNKEDFDRISDDLSKAMNQAASRGTTRDFTHAIISNPFTATPPQDVLTYPLTDVYPDVKIPYEVNIIFKQIKMNQFSMDMVKRLDKLKSKKDVNILIDLILEYPRTNTSMEGVSAIATTTLIINPLFCNKLLQKALELNSPEKAVELFEGLSGFHYETSNEVKDLMKSLSSSDRNSKLKPSVEEDLSIGWSDVVHELKIQNISPTARRVEVNNFICTTAVKAYGRLYRADHTVALMKWMQLNQIPLDTYVLSAIIYVCAKCKKISMAEHLFWKVMPELGISYNIATTNSLMYMYAKYNRPDDALRIFDLIKSLNLQCSVVTYGVLIKALINSRKLSLHETAFEILRSLPKMGITPGIEIYNQFLEYYAKTDNYRHIKSVLRMISKVKPKIQLDYMSYGYIITGFANSKKPRSALKAFYHMVKSKISPNEVAYMGVLKSLATLRDGLSAVQVIKEMYDRKVFPQRQHFSMAMFACVLSNQCVLAESMIGLYRKQYGTPDTVLCTLWLRSLLQQGRWEDAMDLFTRMQREEDASKPSTLTFKYLLEFQILAQKFSDASITLSSMLNHYKKRQSLQESDGQFELIFDALSYSLGIYSNEVTTKYKNDYNLLQISPWASSEGVNVQKTPQTGTMDKRLSAVKEEYRDEFTDDDEEEEEDEEDEEEDVIAENRSNDVMMTDDLTVNRDFQTLVDRTESSSFFTDDMNIPLFLGTPTKPSPNALAFLIQSLEVIGETKSILIPDAFYIEVFKALILEGQPELAEKLLHLRTSNQIRLKIKDMQKIENIELLATRALKQGLIAKKSDDTVRSQ